MKGEKKKELKPLSYHLTPSFPRSLCPGINACMVCGKKSIKFSCPKCKLVAYCSEACRKVDASIPASSPTPGHCVEVCEALKGVASSSEEADRSELEVRLWACWVWGGLRKQRLSEPEGRRYHQRGVFFCCKGGTTRLPPSPPSNLPSPLPPPELPHNALKSPSLPPLLHNRRI